MPDIKLLAPGDWRILQKIRLAALQDSPHAFLATYELEEGYDEARWRAEFTRGKWYVEFPEGKPGAEPVSLVGVTREPERTRRECFLEYLWVAPEFRRNGVASRMINQVVGQLKESGVQTVFLWVLDGNENAAHLYKQLGFVSCNLRQPLEAHPGRSEELMQLDLS